MQELRFPRLFLVRWLFPYKWRNPCTFWHIVLLRIEHFDKTKIKYFLHTTKKTICVTFSCINSLMTVDTQTTDKSVAQQLTATTYDLLSYFFVKKYLLVGASDVLWTGGSWFSRSVDQWEMYVCHTNQIESTIKHQSNFLFLLRVHVTWFFCLFQLNGNFKLSFFSYKWLQLKLTNQWLLFTQSE